MLGRRLELTITFLLLVALVATAFSGLLADYLGIPRSVYHRLSAYSLALLTGCHIVLRWRQLWLRTRAVTRRHPLITAPDACVPWRKSGRSGGPALSRRGLLVSGSAAVAGFILGRWLSPRRLPSSLHGADLGQVYHDWSKPNLASFFDKPFQWGMPPPLYKETYSGQPVPLPKMFAYHGMSVEEAVDKRRSVREYSGEPLTMDQLSLLLHSAYGITEPLYPLRASPSAGALYPLEVYPVVNRVTGLGSGVYHYRPRDHSLDLVKEGDFRSALLVGTGGQDMVLKASVMLVITAVFQRTQWKYQDRAYRYILLDAGHLGENLYLSATSMGLGPCGIGAFLDDEVNQMVGIDGGEEAAVYLISVGRVA